MNHILKYLQFFVSARNTCGHGIHSPFIYDFVQTVVCWRHPYYIFPKIEKIRQRLLRNNKILKINDFGTGKNRQEKVKQIAARSLKAAKYAQMLFRAVHYTGSVGVLELGTSLGITTAYLASPSSKIRCLTFEGSDTLAATARENWRLLKLQNIECVVGNIDNTLERTLATVALPLDFVFIDANHTREATLRYFYLILPFLTTKSIVVVDDIYRSKEMEKAWQEIVAHPKVSASINLFSMGFVFFNPDLERRQYRLLC